MSDSAYKEVDIQKRFERKLYKSMVVASTTSSYSLCVEYMKNWFLSKFDKNYFKTVYIDNRHVLSDNQTFTEMQKLKKLKPSLAIGANIDFDFDNEKIDSYQYGLETYSARGRFHDSFLKDIDNNVYLGMGLNTTLVNFTFKVRVSTRASQIDLAKFMKMAFRVGFTQGEYVNMDFHIPYNLMLQLAHDTGFFIKDEKIVEINKFLNYINSHSTIPFTYKYRCVNGKSEFFLRMDGCYVHISTPSINIDDGETEGHLITNYVVEMPATVRFPSPNYYAYYSQDEHFEITSNPYDNNDSLNCFNTVVFAIPEYDENKWGQYLTTEYMEKDISKPLVIDFNELFEGDMKKVIDYTVTLGLSPNIFMDIKLFNGKGEVTDKFMDWKTCLMTTTNKMESELTYIAIYCDLGYINNSMIAINETEKARIK